MNIMLLLCCDLKHYVSCGFLSSKNCRLFLEAFISGGAILLPQFWKEDAKRAQTFCRDLQMPCRTIQYICEHSKVGLHKLFLIA